MILRYPLKTGWLFYLLVIAYGALISRMTWALWFGDGINVFATYSDAFKDGADLNTIIIDINRIYWAKTCFLFSSMVLIALNYDIRLAFGIGATLWAGSLIVIFGTSTVLLSALALGIALICQSLYLNITAIKTQQTHGS